MTTLATTTDPGDGHPPTPAEGFDAVPAEHPRCDHPLTDVVTTLLASDPTDRPGGADELLSLLQAASTDGTGPPWPPVRRTATTPTHHRDTVREDPMTGPSTQSGTHAAAAPSTATPASPLRRALQVLATLSVLNLISQFVTAGTLVGRSGSDALEGVHSAGAIVLHVLTGLTALVAIAMAAREGAPWWPAVLGAVVFVLTFVQAYFGSGRTLYIHVPGAVVLTIGSVFLLAWAFLGSHRRPVSR